MSRRSPSSACTLTVLVLLIAGTMATPARAMAGGVQDASPAAGPCEGPDSTPETARATPPVAAPESATPPPLADETLDRLFIDDAPISSGPHFFQATLAALPGQTRPLALGVRGERQFVEPVAAAVVWSVAPADCARIDPATGVLTIDPATPHGHVVTVTADIEGGRRLLSIAVYVFTPEANPLVGLWREVARLACDGGTELATAEPVEELVFQADGTFTVTWHPFETYVDYWGTYAYDLAAGTLELTVDNGNEIPPDVDGVGHFAFDGGTLVLTEMWLGTPDWATEPTACGHRFE